MRRIFCFLIVFTGFFSEKLSAQESKIDSVLNEFLFDNEDLLELVRSSRNFQFIYSRLNYDSKTFFAGRDIGIEQFNSTAQMSYFHSIGISIGGAAVYYSQLDPKISTIMLMAGYSNKLFNSTDYRYRISYNRYFFPKSEFLTAGTFNSSLGFGFTFDKKSGGSRIDYSLLIGNELASQLSWDLYADLLIMKFGRSKNIKFEPEISMYFGSDKTIITQVGIVPGRLPRQFTFTEVESQKFGWMNTEIKLPLTINYKDFDFEFGYNFNLPRSLFSSEQIDPSSYFNFSVGYLFSL